MASPQKITVRMWIQESSYTYHVGFIMPGGRHAIGRPSYSYHSQEEVFAILRRAHANLETINIVEHALSEHRSCSVKLELTPEQFARLNRKT